MPQKRRRAPQRRRRKRRFNPLMLLLPLLLIALWLTLNAFVFVVRNVEIVGAGDIEQQAVVRASGILPGTRLDRLNSSQIKANIDATGALAFVELQRRYPTTAVIVVRPRSRDAIALQAGKVLVLDSDGFVISVGDQRPDEDLPYVSGLNATIFRLGQPINATPLRLNALKATLQALKDQNGMAYVAELSLEDTDDIQIITRTGMTVLLGNSENMSRKIAWMLGALRDMESRGETLGRLDVSSGSRADYLPMVIATPAPAVTQNTYLLNSPTPEATQMPTEDVTQ